MGSTQSHDPRLQEVTVGAGSGVWGRAQVLGGGSCLDLLICSRPVLASWLMFIFRGIISPPPPTPPVSVGGATAEGSRGAMSRGILMARKVQSRWLW